jgi:hypothetical protein
MTKLDEAIQEVNDAIDDAVDDYPDVSGDDIVREVVAGVAATLDKVTAAELRRRFGLV